jgi:putative ABC transport system ATP-binding protein
MEAQITTDNLSKVYHANGLPVTALREVDLSFEQGEFSVLAGPSGSGKSTLLHLIGALDRPSSGTVFVGGRDLSKMSATDLADFRLRKIGFVFQAFNLIPVLTGFENVEFTLLLQGVGEKERRDRALTLLEKVGLLDQRDKRPTEMSGGQQQRIAVARALATQPEIVLADEPTANLDSKTGSQLIDLFLKLNGEFNVTFLLASHDPMVIGRARRVVRLKDGHVET